MPKDVFNKTNKFFEALLNIFYEIGEFIISLLEYITHKFDGVLNILHLFTVKNLEMIISLKFKTAGRLIWSRGKLSGQIRFLFIVVFSWFVFMVGGVFQSKLVEDDSEYSTLFLTSSDSILAPSATAATYSGEKTLLDEPVEHEVKEGETLISIARDYGISLESLKFANDLVSNNVKAGTKLMVPPVEGTLHEVKKGDTIEKLAKKYNVPSQTIVDMNYLDAPYELSEGQIVTIPDAQKPSVEKYYSGNNVYDTSAYGILPSGSVTTEGSGNFIWPLGGLLTQGFHRYHPAIDIANNTGDILASDKGTVVRAGWWQGGYGNAVQIDHGNGFVSTYAHMSSISVSNGQQVEKGQKIGVVGSTGRSTGPHVHFTIQHNGQYVNPLNLLQK